MRSTDDDAGPAAWLILCIIRASSAVVIGLRFKIRHQPASVRPSARLDLSPRTNALPCATSNPLLFRELLEETSYCLFFFTFMSELIKASYMSTT